MKKPSRTKKGLSAGVPILKKKIKKLEKSATERKIARKALFESADNYRTFMDSTADFVMLKDDKLKYIMVNEAYCDFFGLPEADILGKTDLELMPKPMAKTCRQTDRQAINEDRIVINIENAQGKVFETRKFPVRLKTGKTCIGAFIRDITEWKRVEEELQESEARYRMLFASAAEGILVAELKTKRFRYANPALCRMFGYTEKEMLQLKVKDIHPKKSLDHVLAEFEAQARGENEKTLALGLPCLRKDGTVFYANISTTSIVINGEKCNVGFFTDITEQKKSAEALKESEELYRGVFENHTAVKLLIDPDTGSIVEANNAAVKYYGWSHEQLRQIKIQEINILSSEEIKKEMEKALTRKRTHFEFRHRRADGSIRDVEVFSSKIAVKGKNLLHSIIHDITERKLAEEKLRIAEEMYRNLFLNAQTGIFRTDMKTGLILDANDCVAMFIGYKDREELLSEPFNIAERYVDAEDRRRLISLLKEHGEFKNFEARFRRNDGSIIWMRYSAKIVPEKGWMEGVSEDITKEKAALEALRESEQKFSKTFRMSPHAMTISTMPDGIYRDLNNAFLSLLGLIREEVIGFSSLDLNLWLNAELRKSFQSKIEAGKEVSSEPVALRMKSGEIKDILYSAVPIQIGGIPYMLSMALDVTERKRMEDKLRESEEKYQILLSESPDPIFSFTPEGQYTYVNRAFAEGVNIPVEEIIGRKIWDVFPRDEADKRFAPLSQVFRTGEEKVIEVRVPRTDGDRYYVTTITPIKDTNGETRSVICSSKNITERKRAEETLQISEEKFSKTFSKAPFLMSINEIKNGIYIDVNEKWIEVSGFSREEAIGKTSLELGFMSREDAIQIAKKLNDQKTVENMEVYLQTKNKRQICCLFSNEIITISGKQVLLCISQDITEKKKIVEERQNIEERLQRAEKMEALGTLAGGVAHDLNNVLGVIVGYSELLLNEMDKSNPARPRVAKIMNGSEKAAAIVQDLLTLARRGVSGRKVLNLNKLILDYQNSPEMEKLSSYNSGVRIKIDLEPNLLNISGSSVHLGKTLFNLISNAIEAMPLGGDLTIKTSNQYLDKSIYGYDEIREGDYVVLSVTDKGEGIPSADIQRIFEPFYTKKIMGRSGTGLGLAVVWGTVKDHHGYINVQSEEGKGSTFMLYFPVTRENVTAESLPVSVSEYMGKGETILVVDDIREQRDLAIEMLKKLNYQVQSVASGEEAIAYLKEHNVDLLVLDMIMDPGLDGLDTYKSILEIQPKQKAIIVSGFSETERVNEAHVLGAGAYVKKPYVMEKLGMAVRNELEKKQG